MTEHNENLPGPNGSDDDRLDPALESMLRSAVHARAQRVQPADNALASILQRGRTEHEGHDRPHSGMPVPQQSAPPEPPTQPLPGHGPRQPGPHQPGPRLQALPGGVAGAHAPEHRPQRRNPLTMLLAAAAAVVIVAVGAVVVSDLTRSPNSQVAGDSAGVSERGQDHAAPQATSTESTESSEAQASKASSSATDPAKPDSAAAKFKWETQPLTPSPMLRQAIDRTPAWSPAKVRSVRVGTLGPTPVAQIDLTAAPRKTDAATARAAFNTLRQIVDEIGGKQGTRLYFQVNGKPVAVLFGSVVVGAGGV